MTPLLTSSLKPASESICTCSKNTLGWPNPSTCDLTWRLSHCWFALNVNCWPENFNARSHHVLGTSSSLCSFVSGPQEWSLRQGLVLPGPAIRAGTPSLDPSPVLGGACSALAPDADSLLPTEHPRTFQCSRAPTVGSFILDHIHNHLAGL